MAAIRIDLDRETYDRLFSQAHAERRPVPWHAEVVIRRALGLPFPSQLIENEQPTLPQDGRTVTGEVRP